MTSVYKKILKAERRIGFYLGFIAATAIFTIAMLIIYIYEY